MARLITTIASRFGLEYRLRADHVKRSAVQCLMAAGLVLILLLVLDAVTQTVLIAALGASSFIAFALPRSLVSSPRCIVGGYVVGILAGTGMHTVNNMLGMSTLLSAHTGVVIFGALATGLAMFAMVMTKTEHPPAAALALGLVLNEWTAVTLLVVAGGAIVLSVCKQLVLPLLMDIA